MNQLESLKGPVAVTATPVIEDGRPDFAELQRQTEWLCGKEITALFPCSSTGEFVRFQFSEKAEILRVTAQAAQGHKKLIAGICGASAGESEDLLERAKEYEYDACVICPGRGNEADPVSCPVFYLRPVPGYYLPINGA